ncbi:MAG TPA: MFS transporter [Acidimicrobiales bacterium]
MAEHARDHLGDGQPNDSEASTGEASADLASEFEDAVEQGDRPIAPGSFRAVLAGRDFRYAFTGAVVSNIGTWMQTVVLAAFAYDLTGSAIFVSLVAFANLVPQLLFSLPGGTLADSVDRRRVVIWATVWQMVFSFGLAAMVTQTDPARAPLLLLVFAVGIGNAVQAPAYSALLPTLVPRDAIQGAISLSSANFNLSRVIGPAIGGVLYSTVGASWVFALNGLTFFVMIFAMRKVDAPLPHRSAEDPSAVRRLLTGFTTAKRDPVLWRSITVMGLFSLACMGFVTQFPVQASENFGISTDSPVYGLLYATLAGGSLVGALGIGFLFKNRPLEQLVRLSLIGFAITLLLYGAVHSPVLAFPAAFLLGINYFAVITSTMTVLQRRVDDAVRGRVVAVAMMAVGGALPVGSLIAGWIVEASDVSVVCVVGSICAVLLALYADMRDHTPGDTTVAPAS